MIHVCKESSSIKCIRKAALTKRSPWSLGALSNTVKSICQRQRLQSFRQLSQEVCKNCGKPLTQVPGRKPREFCSRKVPLRLVEP